MATAERRRGNPQAAQTCLVEAIKLFDEVGSYTIVPVVLLLMAKIAAGLGDDVRAARLGGAARATRSESGALVREREALEGLNWQDRRIVFAWDEGQAMTVRQAVDYAIGAG